MNLRKSFGGALAVATLVFGFGSTQANAAIIVATENFNYPLGNLNGKNGGTGWDGAWAASNSNATITASTPTDSPMSENVALFQGVNNNNAAKRTLAEAQTGNVMVSFLLQFDKGRIDNNDFLGFWFGDSSGPNIGLKANCGNGNCAADIFARTTGTSGAFNFNLGIDNTVEVFGYLQKMNSDFYNKFDLWVNPTRDVKEGWALNNPNASFGISNSNIASFDTIGFRTDGLDTNPTDRIYIDNLAISKVPEPGTVALFGIALMGVALTTRRRKVK